MQIAINVDDKNIAKQILDLLKTFKNDIKIETSNDDFSIEDYQKSELFQKDKTELNQIFYDVQSNKSSLSPVDDTFWDNMDKLIQRA
jgi:hypothetical protein